MTRSTILRKSCPKKSASGPMRRGGTAERFSAFGLELRAVSDEPASRFSKKRIATRCRRPGVLASLERHRDGAAHRSCRCSTTPRSGITCSAAARRQLPGPSDRPDDRSRTKWLVHKDAVEGKDYAIWCTDLGLARNERPYQRVVEENQIGIRSPAYEPGPRPITKRRNAIRRLVLPDPASARRRKIEHQPRRLVSPFGGFLGTIAR